MLTLPTLGRIAPFPGRVEEVMVPEDLGGDVLGGIVVLLMVVTLPTLGNIAPLSRGVEEVMVPEELDGDVLDGEGCSDMELGVEELQAQWIT